jgi:nucleoid DNA-binding protein
MPRVKVQYRTGSKEAYNKFCAVNPNISLSFEKWSEIIYTFNYNFRDHLLETGDRCKLPWGMGTFAVSKKKSKRFVTVKGKEHVNMAIDWAKTNKLGKIVYHLNTHTDGYRFKWVWFSIDARFQYPEIWVWKASRTTSRKLAEYLKRPNSHYPQIYREWDRRK